MKCFCHICTFVQYDPCTYDQYRYQIDSILLHNQSRQYLVNAYYSSLVGSISSPDASNICAYCKGRSCKTLFLQWREYFVGITSSEVAAVLRKWRTEGQRTILRAGMIIDLSSTRSPPQPNPTHKQYIVHWQPMSLIH